MLYEKVGAEFAVNTETAGDQTNPQIATFADGSFLVTWVSRAAWPDSGQTIKAQLFDASGAKLGAEFQVNDQTSGAVFNQTATVLADGTVVVTWINNDYGAGHPGGVKARMFDSAGNPLGGEFQVNTNETGSKFTAEIAALSNGGFVITWDDWGSWDQRAQVYDATGTKVGGEFTTNATTSGFQEYGDVIGLAGGGFVASWRSQSADGTWDVYARTFGNSGTPAGSEFRVNTVTAGTQDSVSLTALADGGFVAVWLSSGAVKGQLFTASGSKVGIEFTVNQVGGTLQGPDVTALADGGFFVAWATLNSAADGSGMAVKVRQFGADGVPAGNEMLLNTYTSGSQFLPDIEALADGRVVASWVSENVDGNGYAVRGQMLYVVNAAPEITSDGGGPVANLGIAENETAVTTVHAVDGDGPLPVSYRIAGGADAAAFVIDEATGALSFAAGPDFETWADADGNNVYQVVVEARDGTGTDSQTINVAVGDLGDGLSFRRTTLQASELSLAAGVLSASGGNGDPTGYSITGGADAALFTLDAQSGALSFVAERDFEVAGDANGDNIYQLEVTASDGVYDVTRTISVVLNNVNEGLAIVSADAASLVENTVSVATVAATDVDGDAPRYGITGGADGMLFYIDPETGELSFGEAPDFEAPADWDGDNVYEVEVSATDGEFTTSQLVTVTVTDVADAPLSLVTTDFEFAENAFINPALEVTGGLGTDLVTYWISGGADGDLFYMDNDTDSLLLEPRDYEMPTDWDGDNLYEVEVTVTDGVFTTTQLVTIAVVDVNDTPLSIVATHFEFAENSFINPALEVTGGLGTNLVTYWISGGADGGLFSMDNDTDSLLLEARDYEMPTDWDGDNLYEVEVSVTDGEFTTTQLVTIAIGDVEEVPPLSFANTDFAFLENAMITADLGVTGGSGTNSLMYWISGGADAALFALSSYDHGLLLGPQDFEAPADADGDNVYEVEVSVTDGELTTSQLVTVAIGDVEDTPPLAFSSTAFSVGENTALAAPLAVTGGGPGPVSYAIAGGADANRFAIDAASGALLLTARNYEAPADWNRDNLYEVYVTAERGAGSVTELVTVKVLNVDEAPTIVSNGGGAQVGLTVNENGVAVTTVAASDPEGSVFYDLAGGADAAWFAIDGQTGALRFLSAPDFEMPGDSDGDNVYEVTVSASDGNLVDTQELFIAVGNLADGDTINGTAGNDVLVGSGAAETLNGMAGNDLLRGEGGIDVLNGGDGLDRLVGGAGRDQLIGGLGADLFQFAAAGESTVSASDMILDFDRSQGDRIVLQDIDASTRASGNQAFQFIGSSPFSSGSPSFGQLRAFHSGGDTFIQGDVNGDRVADFQIVLDGLVMLSSSDFVL